MPLDDSLGFVCNGVVGDGDGGRGGVVHVMSRLAVHIVVMLLASLMSDQTCDEQETARYFSPRSGESRRLSRHACWAAGRGFPGWYGGSGREGTYATPPLLDHGMSGWITKYPLLGALRRNYCALICWAPPCLDGWVGAC